MTSTSLHKTVLLLFSFSLAMGFMEAAVVVYLRELYYPLGFDFPMSVIPANIATVEILRELATIIMLVTVGWLAGKNRAQRFSFFLFSFAIWDMVYYLFLKIFLDWPESLLTWDILFLIPVPWIGPVLAPVILSLTMILPTLLLVWLDNRNIEMKISYGALSFLICGSLITISSFIWDFLYLVSNATPVAAGIPEQEGALKELSGYIPSVFNWWLFFIGELFIITGIFFIFRKSNKPVSFKGFTNEYWIEQS